MLVLKADEKVLITLAPVDSLGNPAALDGIPVWSVSDPTVLSLVVANDGLSGEVVTLGPLGSARLVVTVDARMGPDVKELVGFEDFEVIAAEASSLGLSVGTPTSRLP